MLYYILPPVIMVLSLAVLIFYIFRKSENINIEEIARSNSSAPARAKIDVPKPSRIFQLFLLFLEKITQRFKTFSLKIYTRTDKWFQSIKEKRKNNQTLRKENKDNFSQKEVKSLDLLQKMPEPLEEIQFQRKRENAPEPKTSEEVLPPRPTVSQEAVQPEILVREKDKFEKLLIERIASNPKDIEAYERLGTYYIEVGNFPDSLECFEQVLRLSPAHRRARIQTRRLGKILGK